MRVERIRNVGVDAVDWNHQLIVVTFPDGDTWDMNYRSVQDLKISEQAMRSHRSVTLLMEVGKEGFFSKEKLNVVGIEVE